MLHHQHHHHIIISQPAVFLPHILVYIHLLNDDNKKQQHTQDGSWLCCGHCLRTRLTCKSCLLAHIGCWHTTHIHTIYQPGLCQRGQHFIRKGMCIMCCGMSRRKKPIHFSSRMALLVAHSSSRRPINVYVRAAVSEIFTFHRCYTTFVLSVSLKSKQQ